MFSSRFDSFFEIVSRGSTPAIFLKRTIGVPETSVFGSQPRPSLSLNQMRVSGSSAEFFTSFLPFAGTLMSTNTLSPRRNNQPEIEAPIARTLCKISYSHIPTSAAFIAFPWDCSSSSSAEISSLHSAITISRTPSSVLPVRVGALSGLISNIQPLPSAKCIQLLFSTRHRIFTTHTSPGTITKPLLTRSLSDGASRTSANS
mmetsp:Transcript_27997/g.45047  ORF Transcript_27997/g.45047 Transcript_27997/m.45047 type:complete len:202 (+) Transcript_27997:107-712(+)